jgi:hypothetical protein
VGFGRERKRTTNREKEEELLVLLEALEAVDAS